MGSGFGGVELRVFRDRGFGVLGLRGILDVQDWQALGSYTPQPLASNPKQTPLSPHITFQQG